MFRRGERKRHALEAAGRDGAERPRVDSARTGTVWPELNAPIAGRLADIFDVFYATSDVSATQGPLTDLLTLTGTNIMRYAQGETVWQCFMDWSEGVAEGETENELAIVQIGYFADIYHQQFAPQAGTAVHFIGRATDDQRNAIMSRAFEACASLGDNDHVSVRHTVFVRDVQANWSQVLGRPVERLTGARAHGQTENDSLERCLEDAESGDEAAQLFMAAVVLKAEGRSGEALNLLERAAELGHVKAMLAAADIAQEMGLTGVNTFWTEQAARIGDPVGMFNMGVLKVGAGDAAEAQRYFEAAGAAGNTEAYAALTDMASRAGMLEAAEHWATLGAQQGHPFCLEAHALQVLRGNENNRSVFLQALQLIEDAARQGYVPAMDRCGIMHYHSGNHVQAKYWWEQAVRAGDPDAGDRLVKYGLATGEQPEVDRPPSQETWEHATIWYGQEASLKAENLGTMIWTAQIMWPGTDRLEIRDEVSIDDVLKELVSAGWELVSAAPSNGINGREFTLRRSVC